MNNGCENNNITPHMDALNYNEKKMHKNSLFSVSFLLFWANTNLTTYAQLTVQDLLAFC